MLIQADTLHLTEADVNELVFVLANIQSPSRNSALDLANAWRTKLTVARRKMHPAPTKSVNVN